MEVWLLSADGDSAWRRDSPFPFFPLATNRGSHVDVDGGVPNVNAKEKKCGEESGLGQIKVEWEKSSGVVAAQ